MATIGFWLALETNQARRQRAAVTAIRASGGQVGYDFQRALGKGQLAQEPPGPKWLRDLIGDEYFQDVVEVRWGSGRDVRANDLRWLADFPKLDRVNLNFANVGDEGLTHLEDLTSLKHLQLEKCTKVTDRGLSRLAKLQRLEELALLGTGCSDEGVRKYVPRFRRLVYLDVSGIPISNDTAKEFRNLKDLRMLHLSRVGQRATYDLSEAVQLLKKELPKCKVNYWPPS